MYLINLCMVCAHTTPFMGCGTWAGMWGGWVAATHLCTLSGETDVEELPAEGQHGARGQAYIQLLLCHVAFSSHAGSSVSVTPCLRLARFARVPAYSLEHITPY